MGLLDSFPMAPKESDDEIKWNRVDLDPGTIDLINREYQRSQLGTPVFQANRREAISGTPDFTNVKPETFGSQNLSSVIGNRYRSRMASKLNELNTKADFGGFRDAFNARQIAFQSTQAAANIKLRNAEMEYKAQAANEEARAAVMRNLLGVVGVVAGAIIGGPAGAAVGGAMATAVAGKGQDQSAFMADEDSALWQKQSSPYDNVRSGANLDLHSSRFSKDALRSNRNREGVGY